ncbi:hypothetical protein MBANPS3_006550 [Mucor bainieri]
MSFELSGKPVYVVSSGIQLDPQENGQVETNPIKVFSTKENARAYAKDLAKKLFWERLKDGCSRKDGYDTPSDDDFSCDGHFDEEGEDYISFSYKPSFRLTDDESDTGYVSVDLMYIDEAIKEKTVDANGSNKKRKLVGNNPLPVPVPFTAMYSASTLPPPSAFFFPASAVPTTTMPQLNPSLSDPPVAPYDQPDYVSSRYPPDLDPYCQRPSHVLNSQPSASNAPKIGLCTFQKPQNGDSKVVWLRGCCKDYHLTCDFLHKSNRKMHYM